MASFGYPQYGKSQSSGKVGESFIELFIHQELKWIYRPIHQESDFGIDGYVDIIESDYVTGKTIGLQIKCGDSYYQKKTSGGIRYDGDNKHLNYYLNYPFPIILVILNTACSKAYWVEFNVDMTEPSKNGWWIEIPEYNPLDISAKEKWKSIAGPSSDYSEQITLSWETNKIIEESDSRVFIIDRSSIEVCYFNGIKNFIDRLSRNKKTLIGNRGKTSFLISGFDDDSREVYEIPEVRRWYSRSIEVGIPWFYFLNDDFNGMALLVVLYAYCDVVVSHEENGTVCVEIIDMEEITQWLTSNFNNLNHFIESKNISEDINEEMGTRAYAIVKNIIFSS